MNSVADVILSQPKYFKGIFTIGEKCSGKTKFMINLLKGFRNIVTQTSLENSKQDQII